MPVLAAGVVPDHLASLSWTVPLSVVATTYESLRQFALSADSLRVPNAVGIRAL